MTFDEALAKIRAFWSEPDFPFEGTADGAAVAEALEREFGRAFPPVVREYVARVLAPAHRTFQGVGNPHDLYGSKELSSRVAGYNVHGLTGETLEGWSEDWLLIGDEGADPYIVDLGAKDGGDVPVLQAMHGAAEWEFEPVAESLPQFVLLLALLHHALTMPVAGIDDRITDDERGFNLHDDSAAWLFPRVRRFAPAFYGHWVGAFDNA